MDLGDLHRFQGVVVPSCGTSLQNSARPEAIVSGRPSRRHPGAPFGYRDKCKEFAEITCKTPQTSTRTE